MKISKITISGIESQPTPAEHHEDSVLSISRSFNIVKITRGGDEEYNVDLKDEEMIEFIFEDDTKWLCNADTIAELFPEAQKFTVRSGKARFKVPQAIDDQKSKRGFGGKILLKIINILTKKIVHKTVGYLAQQFEDKLLDGKEGLFETKPDLDLVDFQENNNNNENTYCLLLHGTASNVEGSFGGAKDTQLMQYLQQTYKNRVLAFQHRTLTENPLQNVQKLIDALPTSCTLHLMTTSRGGLVGEVLSRFCNGKNNIGFSDGELAFFNANYGDKYAKSLSEISEKIRKSLENKTIIIEKFIRIACPAGGTTLASNRLDNYFNVLLNLIGFNTNIAFVAFKNLLSAVVGAKDNVDALPGLEVQRPSSPFIEVINGLDQQSSVTIHNSLVVISGDTGVYFNMKALVAIVAKLFFQCRNDLVVDTKSMSLGTPRKGKVQEFYCDEKDINHFSYFKNSVTHDAIYLAFTSRWGDLLSGFTERTLDAAVKRGFDLTKNKIERPMDRYDSHIIPTEERKPIYVSISQGNLFYAKYPVLAGHLKGDAILYAEKQIDTCLGGMLNKYTELGNYPENIEENKSFLTKKNGFNGAIIVGLGIPEQLTPSELTKTVEKGVIDYLFGLNNELSADCPSKDNEEIGISSLIIGAGYGGLPVENSVRAIIHGIYNANIKTRREYPDSKCEIKHIEFIELYEDKAMNCLFFLDRIKDDETSTYKIVLKDKKVKSLLGAKKRIPRDDSKEWWNRLTVLKKEDDHKGIMGLNFSTATKSAREEEQELFTTPSLVQATVNEISTDDKWNQKRAKTIFEMLIPNGFKSELMRHGNIVWVLDAYTATYPWELLQEGTNSTKPICVSSGMIRQLRTTKTKQTIERAVKNSALVIADPFLDGYTTQLKGALDEGKEVGDMLRDNKFIVTDSFGEVHSQIIEKFFSDDYKIIHLSGHGVFDEDPSRGSGMLIGNGMYLSTREIKQMSVVPEFVFVNCCHLGKTDGAAEELFQQRFKLAANIGTQLINNGVKCVIAAGWAVDDAAALDFAKTFYGHMFEGNTFGEAVKLARELVFNSYGANSNTWGAYQCYGDPFYSFRKADIAQTKKSYLIEQEAEIDLTNLLNEIELGKPQQKTNIEELNSILKEIERNKFKSIRITELKALIHFELRMYDKACSEFEELLESNNANFSFEAVEKYQNARVKKTVEEWKKTKNSSDLLVTIDAVIEDLSDLQKISRTSEGLNILASAYKRKALLSTEKQSKVDAYERAAYYSQQANNIDSKVYSLCNSLSMQAVLILAKLHKWGGKITIGDMSYQLMLLKTALEKLEKSKEAISNNPRNMDYWGMIDRINIGLCRYILNFKRSEDYTQLDEIFDSIKALWAKAGSVGKQFVEIEHLEIIIDALSIVENDSTNALRNNLTSLKQGLEELCFTTTEGKVSEA